MLRDTIFHRAKAVSILPVQHVKETISRVCNFSQFFVTVIIGSTRTVNDLPLFSLFAFERIVVAPPTVTVS